MTPSKEELQDKARHFANTVFVVGAGVLMLAASMLQTFAVSRMGENGGDMVFIAATILIFVLASKRSELALFATERQCQKYGHVLRADSPVCERCMQTVAADKRQ